MENYESPVQKRVRKNSRGGVEGRGQAVAFGPLCLLSRPTESEIAQKRVARRRPGRWVEAKQAQAMGQVRTWGFILDLK